MFPNSCNLQLVTMRPAFDLTRHPAATAARSWLVLAAVVCAAANLEETRAADAEVSFAQQVQPLLARKCFPCHGPDKAEGGLRLHQREAALGATDSGQAAIVPGKPAESELIRRVVSEDDSVRMPQKGKALAAEEIALLRNWIAQGAKWQSHWAFEPVRPVQPPPVRRKEWVRNGIDAFILARLEAHGLAPSSPAEPLALLRRVYFDLTGLPPSPADVEAFQREAAVDLDAAYERVVDKLLDSPRYGERWARHWLDVVRFAETNSFERDGPKPYAWRYRDYVIRALNDDKPYDVFIREQLAGDELAEPSADAIIATGFYRLGLWDDEPADPLLARYDGLDDIVTTTGQAFLGLTVNCARCHDHKIDPIPQRDYYGLLAFFHNITPNGYENPNVVRPIFPQPGDRERFEQAQRALRDQQNAVQAELTAIEDALRRGLAQQGTDAQVSDLDDVEYKFYRDTWDKLPNFDDLKPETAAKLERPYFDIRLATREDYFGFVFHAILKVPADGEYTFTLDSDDGSRLLLDGKEILNYDGIHGVGKPKTATVALKAGRLPIRVDYFQGRFGKGLEVAWSGPGFKRRYLSATTANGTDIASLSKSQNVQELMAAQGAAILGAEKVEQYNALQKRLEELKRRKPWDHYALCVTEHGPQAPETFILRRGSPQAPGERALPRFLEALGGGVAEIPPPAAGAVTSGRRMVLANWIASPDNQLTARVMVNRLWQHHFGRGIVRSPNNFGQLGEPPTHPELLDWLAGEFVRGGWRIKRMHKLMVLSNTYRQAAEKSAPDNVAANPPSGGHAAPGNRNPQSAAGDAQSLDPANNYFWRFNMRRLSAEELRDAMLAVNGRLNLKMYGPGFYPDISAEVLAGQSKPGSGWGKSSYEEQARRSVYIHVKRSLQVPLLASFDFPDTDTSCEARFVTTQPGQALGLLNGDFVNQQAGEFAARLQREAGPETKKQVALALRLALCREPRDEEIQRGLKLIAQLQTKHQQSPDEALRHYCLLVFNLNEFVYVD